MMTKLGAEEIGAVISFTKFVGTAEQSMLDGTRSRWRSLMCLIEVPTLPDYQARVANRPGQYVVLNVAFPDGNAEAVRVNIGRDTASCVRANGSILGRWRRENPPFNPLQNAVALSSPCLKIWRRNFACIHDAIPFQEPLVDIKQEDPRNTRILTHLQACEAEIHTINHALMTLPVQTALYHGYHAKASIAALADHQNLLNHGKLLLHNVGVAIDVYSNVPRLALPFNEEGVGEPQPQQRGAVLRAFLQRGPNQLGCDPPLDFIDYEVRPLRINGLNWQQNVPPGDIRFDAADLLLAYNGSLLVAETKMVGDTWPSSGLQQVLYYGSMLAHADQIRRAEQIYNLHFARDVWLGLIVQRRDDLAWRADLGQTLAFATHPQTMVTLADHFAGLRVVEIEEVPPGWRIVIEHRIPWN